MLKYFFKQPLSIFPYWKGLIKIDRLLHSFWHGQLVLISVEVLILKKMINQGGAREDEETSKTNKFLNKDKFSNNLLFVGFICMTVLCIWSSICLSNTNKCLFKWESTFCNEDRACFKCLLRSYYWLMMTPLILFTPKKYKIFKTVDGIVCFRNTQNT